MPRYASGKKAYFISDRSGFRFPYREMRKEWNGSIVAAEEFERKQPQLGPFRKVSDAQALKDARPDVGTENVQTFSVITTNGVIYLGNGNWGTSGVSQMPSKIEDTSTLLGSVGQVTVAIT